MHYWERFSFIFSSLIFCRFLVWNDKSSFFPYMGGAAKPPPIGIKSDVKSFPNRSFFSFNICIYKTKFWTMNENISQWNYSSSMIFCWLLLEMTSQIFTVKGRGSQAPSPRCKMWRLSFSSLSFVNVIFSIYKTKFWQWQKDKFLYLCAVEGHTEGNLYYNYRL